MGGRKRCPAKKYSNTGVGASFHARTMFYYVVGAVREPPLHYGHSDVPAPNTMFVVGARFHACPLFFIMS